MRFSLTVRATLAFGVLFAVGSSAHSKTPTRGPFVFACVGDSAETLKVTFLGATADRARLSYKGETVVAKHAVSADGGRYTAPQIEFWNKGEDGVLEWRGDKLKCAIEH